MKADCIISLSSDEQLSYVVEGEIPFDMPGYVSFQICDGDGKWHVDHIREDCVWRIRLFPRED